MDWFKGKVTGNPGNPIFHGKIHNDKLVGGGGWATPLKNMIVNWDDVNRLIKPQFWSPLVAPATSIRDS